MSDEREMSTTATDAQSKSPPWFAINVAVLCVLAPWAMLEKTAKVDQWAYSRKGSLQPVEDHRLSQSAYDSRGRNPGIWP